jgi:hypothetical protein
MDAPLERLVRHVVEAMHPLEICSSEAVPGIVPGLQVTTTFSS